MKLLIVDDDPLIVELLQMAMREAGHATDVAVTCAQGRTLAMVHDFDAVILDYNLPDCSGLEVIRDLSGRGNATPVLILTSRSSKESLIECLNAGADDYLVKPFDTGELLARVHALARRGGAAREESGETP